MSRDMVSTFANEADFNNIIKILNPILSSSKMNRIIIVHI